MSVPKPVVLCILDGWGKRAETQGNAPALAETPNFDRIMATCPNAQLLTHGPDAGLPTGQMGNSEVGHTNIGAGRVVAMDLGQIDLAIEDGSFGEMPALVSFIDTLKASGGTAHLLGVISDGGVHGHIAHVLEAAKIIATAGVPVVIHAVTDGRDVAPKSAQDYFATLMDGLPQGAQVGTVIGRYFALDRDNRWDRVQTAFAAIVHGKGDVAATPQDAIAAAYANDQTDEFIPATVIDGYGGFVPRDGLFCLNFRSDRAREILAAIGDPAFDGFAREMPVLAARLGMVTYSDAHEDWYETVFPKREIKNTLGAWVAYDLQPEMSSAEVTDAFVAAIEKGYDLIVTNYANPDMVGHTGDLAAAMAACAAVDAGLGRVLEALEAAGGAMIVTADHGNCETMIDPETGGPHTAHTLNPVPVALVGGPKGATLRDGRLADLAPTLLSLLGVEQPAEMTGQSLINA